MKLRIIAVETDFGEAANIGGPVFTSYVTFDMECPTELAEFLKCGQPWKNRGIVGVQVIHATEYS